MLGIVGRLPDSTRIADSRSNRDAHSPTESSKSFERSEASVCSPAPQLQMRQSQMRSRNLDERSAV